jgi:hypothetical protein
MLPRAWRLVLGLAVALAAQLAAGHTCFVDYTADSDKVTVTSSGVWGSIPFDMSVRVSLCAEFPMYMEQLFLVLNNTEMNATVLTQQALVASVGTTLVWRANVSQKVDMFDGKTHVSFSSLLEWREGMTSADDTPIVKIQLCPDVKLGFLRNCVANPAEGAMTTIFIVVTLVLAGIILGVAGLKKMSMQSHTTKFERATRFESEHVVRPQEVQDRVEVDAAMLAKTFAGSPTTTGAASPRHTVDAASGLARGAHILLDESTGEPYSALLSHTGQDERTLRYCVMQLLVTDLDHPKVPAGSVLLWVRKGRVGSTGRATLLKYKDRDIAVYEYIGLLNQQLSEAWQLRRGSLEHSEHRREASQSFPTTTPTPDQASAPKVAFSLQQYQEQQRLQHDEAETPTPSGTSVLPRTPGEDMEPSRSSLLTSASGVDSAAGRSASRLPNPMSVTQTAVFVPAASAEEGVAGRQPEADNGASPVIPVSPDVAAPQDAQLFIPPASASATLAQSLGEQSAGSLDVDHPVMQAQTVPPTPESRIAMPGGFSPYDLNPHSLNADPPQRLDTSGGDRTPGPDDSTGSVGRQSTEAEHEAAEESQADETVQETHTGHQQPEDERRDADTADGSTSETRHRADDGPGFADHEQPSATVDEAPLQQEEQELPRDAEPPRDEEPLHAEAPPHAEEEPQHADEHLQEEESPHEAEAETTPQVGEPQREVEPPAEKEEEEEVPAAALAAYDARDAAHQAAEERAHQFDPFEEEPEQEEGFEPIDTAVGDRIDSPFVEVDVPTPTSRQSFRPFVGFSLLEHVHDVTDPELTVDALWRGGPAAIAGLSVGDLVTHIDHTRVTDLQTVRRIILESAIVGSTIDVTFVEHGSSEPQEVAVPVLTTDEDARGTEHFYDTEQHSQDVSPRRSTPH